MERKQTTDRIEKKSILKWLLIFITIALIILVAVNWGDFSEAFTSGWNSR